MAPANSSVREHFAPEFGAAKSLFDDEQVIGALTILDTVMPFKAHAIREYVPTGHNASGRQQREGVNVLSRFVQEREVPELWRARRFILISMHSAKYVQHTCTAVGRAFLLALNALCRVGGLVACLAHRTSYSFLSSLFTAIQRFLSCIASAAGLIIFASHFMFIHSHSQIQTTHTAAQPKAHVARVARATTVCAKQRGRTNARVEALTLPF